MRKSELLIAQSRRATESTEFSGDAGIQDAEFLEYLNNGQDRIFAAILGVHPEVFKSEVEIACQTGVEAYDLPVNTYLRTKLDLVEYSPTGRDQDYYDLSKGRLRERISSAPNEPAFYIRRNNQVLIEPSPPNSNGTLRINYYKKLPTLDKRRGTVGAVTLNAGAITLLTIDITTISTDDITDIEDLGYLTIVDKDGIVKMSAIPVSSIDLSTGVVTLDGSFAYDTDEETIAVGNYVCAGKYSTTHSYLDDSCERYLLAHCDWKILKRDSSSDSVEQNEELKDILVEIVATYKDADEDVDYIPILDTQFLDSSGG